MPPTALPARSHVIRVLPPLVANQIAAGEVVERPASVVKELLDNALDAGARRVVIELEMGGIELVRITDDGHGIAEEQLKLALAPHATSKISDAADLERIGTLGFRGEALASIKSVSRLSLRSRTAEMEGAAVIEAEGETATAIAPASGPVGTQITVRNLFFNTPARRKFLRTPNTEQGRCLDVIRELAMANPGIALKLVTDGRTGIDLPADQSPRDRVLAVLGKELAEQLIEVNGEDRGRGEAPGRATFAEAAAPISLWGLVGLPGLARATTAAQHVFINGRPVRDRTIQHAIKEAYRGLIEPGRHPTAALMIEMSPAEVDVNVHPAKAEVRFRESSRIHSLVLRTIREVLQGADLTPVVRTFAGPSGFGDRGVLPALVGPDAAAAEQAQHQTHQTPQRRESASGSAGAAGFVDYFRRTIPGASGGGRLSYDRVRSAVEAADSLAAISQPAPPMEVSPSLTDARPTPRALQVHNSFLVTQDEQGVVIIDQHALHERVMFEKLLARLGTGEAGGRRLESQHLLAPMIVPASPAQVDRLEAVRELFDKIGVVATAAGPASIAVSAFPTFLFERGVDAGPFLTELLERAESSGFVPGSEEALHEVLDMMACKAAVKAGDHLSDGELTELLELRESVERSSNCPHGRPTSIRMTIAELEKRFGRT